MGRYVSGSGGGSGRTKIVRLTASDAAVPIPEWAKVAYISGTGGGAGGGNYTGSNNWRGGGGSAGAFAVRAPMLINGATTASVTIGAGGTGAAGNTNGAGTHGGATIVEIGAEKITLGGGSAGFGYTGGTSGFAYTGDSGKGTIGSSSNSSGFWAPPSPFGQGAAGSGGNGAGGNGGSSLWGGGGDGLTAPGTGVDQAGVNGYGYGSGGSGSVTNAKAGDGTSGIVFIEFVETV